MTSVRTDLDGNRQTKTYIVFTVMLVILSLVGVFLFFRLNSSGSSGSLPPALSTAVPTPAAEIPVDSSLAPTSPADDTMTTSAPTPTPATLNFQSDTDKFSVSYASYRKLYQDTESSGNRYTFYSSQGNFAVHVGTDWSWVYPNRVFTMDHPVSGQATFEYDIPTQTIVDIQTDTLKYTIQCIHHGNADLEAECQQFISSFQLL